MPKWYKTTPREWERPNVPLKDFRPFKPAARMPTPEEVGKTSLERGDLLYTPFGMAQVVDLDWMRARLWPAYGQDNGWFGRWQVTIWRNDTWNNWYHAGLEPVDLARAMFPENW